VLKGIAELCEGFSGRDIRNLIEHGTTLAIERAISRGEPKKFALIAADFSNAYTNSGISHRH
jgi:hypothetical protein